MRSVENGLKLIKVYPNIHVTYTAQKHDKNEDIGKSGANLYTLNCSLNMTLIDDCLKHTPNLEILDCGMNKNFTDKSLILYS